MKPPPAGWPRMASGVYYRNAAAMIDWLCRAFGFEVKLRVEGDDGRIRHSELVYGGGLIMVGEEQAGASRRFDTDCLSPLSAGGNTQNLMVYVDDLDAHCAAARAAGARVVSEPALHDHGEDYWADRSYGCLDPEGHLWWFSQRLRG
ncbi:MAG: VOC family protein [Rubrivivax sp.]